MSVFTFNGSGRIASSTNAIAVHVWGLPFDSSGNLVVSDGSGAPNYYQNGWPFVTSGAVAIHLGGIITSYSNGLPITAAGRIATDNSNSVTTHTNGLPIAGANNRLSVS